MTKTVIIKTIIMHIERKYKHQTGGYGGCLLAFIIMTAIGVWIALSSCSKTKMVEWNTYDDYSLVVDWRSLDTTTLYKRTQWNYREYSPQIKKQFEESKDMWYIDCNMRDRQQHLYYLKNGKKIQESSWPKAGEVPVQTELKTNK